jgi:hypothetical protein
MPYIKANWFRNQNQQREKKQVLEMIKSTIESSVTERSKIIIPTIGYHQKFKKCVGEIIEVNNKTYLLKEIKESEPLEVNGINFNTVPHLIIEKQGGR